MRRLTRAQARRLAIAAQGLGTPRPQATPNVGHVRRVVRNLGLVQIDSVNVVERAHHLTLFSRLGPHDPDLLWRALEQRKLFEYWGRMASFCPIEDFPLYRPRMARFGEVRSRWISNIEAKAPGYLDSVYRQVAERGPLTTAELEEPGESSGPWWGWADGKVALEYLFMSGRVTVAYRRNFTRYYDVVERVVPPEYLAGPAPSREEAHRRLILQAAQAQGVGTARDLVDYYWIRIAEGKPVLAELVAEGSLVEVEVEGWAAPAFVPAHAAVPRSLHTRTLVNAFDPFMWNRERIQRLFDFHYRIEIYVPKPKRVYGYYVVAFLLDDHLVARVDLKADRQAGVLRIPGAFVEDGADPVRVASDLGDELEELARWLGLDAIAVGTKGDLAGPLRKALR